MTVESVDTTAEVARAVAAERLTFFADAVIAIAITLLALELPVPHGSSNRDLLHSVAELRGDYVAFLISFLVVGAHWSGHHRVFRYVDTLGGRLGTLSLLWLLMQIITPYATKILTGDGGFQTRFIFYAAVQASAGLLFAAMVLQIKHHRLYRDGTPPAVFAGALTSTLSLAAAFLISIPISFVTHYSYVCWMLIPLLPRLIRTIHARRVRRAA